MEVKMDSEETLVAAKPFLAGNDAGAKEKGRQ